MRGIPTMTTEQMLRLTLDEASRYPADDLDHIWRMNACRRFAAMIASREDETRTADQIMADAMHSMKEAA